MDDDPQEGEARKVEQRIVGEFLLGLHKADVNPEIPEIMEDIMYEDDFGGKEVIVEKVESRLLPEDLVVENGD